MAYYSVLATEWATLSGSTAQKLATVNAMTVAGPNLDVSVGEVIGYLALNAKLSNLDAYAVSPPSGAVAQAVVAAKELMTLFGTAGFTTFQMSNPAIYAGVQGFLNALASDPLTGIASTDVTALLALCATTIPWWQANGYTSPFTQADLSAAGLS